MADLSTIASHDLDDETRTSPTAVEVSTEPTYPHVSDDDPVEEDPSEEDPSEADPSEENLSEPEPSEEEPMELEPPEDPSPRPVTPTSPISPTPILSVPHYHRSGGARTMRTARISVRVPRASPYPTPTATAPTSDVPTDTPAIRARRRIDVRRWGWLPDTLDTWRAEEGMQIPLEVGDSSIHTSTYTQEPIHYTVPVLAARLQRHQNMIDAMEVEQQETRSAWMHLAQDRVAQIYQDQQDIRNDMDVAQVQRAETRDEVAALRQRLEQCELRSLEAEQHSQMLERLLTMANESVRLAGRLTDAVNRVITLMPPPDQQ